jgi:hypothetical protein
VSIGNGLSHSRLTLTANDTVSALGWDWFCCWHAVGSWHLSCCRSNLKMPSTLMLMKCFSSNPTAFIERHQVVQKKTPRKHLHFRLTPSGAKHESQTKTTSVKVCMEYVLLEYRSTQNLDGMRLQACPSPL